MYCGKCNMREVAPNPYGIDICPQCNTEERDTLDTERIGAEYSIELYQNRIAELEAALEEKKKIELDLLSLLDKALMNLADIPLVYEIEEYFGKLADAALAKAKEAGACSGQ